MVPVRDGGACLQQVNVLLGGDKEPTETLSRRSAIRARLEDLDANHDGAPSHSDLAAALNCRHTFCSHTRHHH
jgi:hypothetical protein